jgi:hypothetical protein
MRFQRADGADLAGRLFGRDSRHALELMRAAWPRAVGGDVARRTEVVSLDGRTLRIRVPDAGWRRVLHRMQPDILARLRRVAGEVAPQRLGFVEGPVAEALPAAAPEARPAESATCPAAVAQGAAAIADSELRARFLQTAGRYLARASARAVR